MHWFGVVEETSDAYMLTCHTFVVVVSGIQSKKLFPLDYHDGHAKRLRTKIYPAECAVRILESN